MVKKNKQEQTVKAILDRKDQVTAKGYSKILYKVLWQGRKQSDAVWESARKLREYPLIWKDIQKFNEKWKSKSKQIIEPDDEKPQTKSNKMTKNNKIQKVSKGESKSIEIQIQSINSSKLSLKQKFLKASQITDEKQQMHLQPSQTTQKKQQKVTKTSNIKQKQKQKNMKSQKDLVGISLNLSTRNNKNNVIFEKQKSLCPKQSRILQLVNKKPTQDTNKKLKSNAKSQRDKKPQKRQSKEVVSKILEKMRENTEKSEKSLISSRQFEDKQKQKKIIFQIKQKVAALNHDKKKGNPKLAEKNVKSKIKAKSQKFLHQNLSKQTLKQKNSLEITKQLTLPQNLPLVQSNTSKSMLIITQKDADHYIDNPTSITQTSQVQEHVPAQSIQSNQFEPIMEQKGALLKLEDQGDQRIIITETQEKIPSNGVKNTKSNSIQSINEKVEEVFQIKGMLICQNQYYFLVEENGNSQIISRADILNTHPYELICFYEKRINIRPAEVNFMVL